MNRVLLLGLIFYLSFANEKRQRIKIFTVPFELFPDSRLNRQKPYSKPFLWKGSRHGFVPYTRTSEHLALAFPFSFCKPAWDPCGMS